MAREHDLEAALTELFIHVKGLHAVLSSVMIDIAALRKSSINDATMSTSYAKHARNGVKIARPLLDEALRSYDEIVERIRACDEPCSEDRESTTTAKIRLQ